MSGPTPWTAARGGRAALAVVAVAAACTSAPRDPDATPTPLADASTDGASARPADASPDAQAVTDAAPQDADVDAGLEGAATLVAATPPAGRGSLQVLPNVWGSQATGLLVGTGTYVVDGSPLTATCPVPGDVVLATRFVAGAAQLACGTYLEPSGARLEGETLLLGATRPTDVVLTRVLWSTPPGVQATVLRRIYTTRGAPRPVGEILFGEAGSDFAWFNGYGTVFGAVDPPNDPGLARLHIVFGLAPRTDGSRWIVGMTITGNLAVARLTTDLRLDTTLGAEGVVDLGRGARSARVVATDDGGAVIVVRPRSGAPLEALRLTPDALLDPSYGVAGVITSPLAYDAAENGLAGFAERSGAVRFGGVRADRKLEPSPHVDLEVSTVRVLPNGSTDTTFGAGGVARFTLSLPGEPAFYTVQLAGSADLVGSRGELSAMVWWPPLPSSRSGFGPLFLATVVP